MSVQSNIVIGSRGSELALWQSHWVEKRLAALHPSIQIDVQIIKTTGDKILDAPLSKIGDKGLFTKELENALLGGDIDIAIHSLKDVPTLVQKGLRISAICEREDVHDVFMSHPGRSHKSLSAVPMHGIIATGSLRRKFLLLRFRPDLRVVDIRGNLGTRIEKLGHSDWDGMLLAKAGLERLGKSQLITEVLPLANFLPAVGQGALAIETREGDHHLGLLVKPLDHLHTRQSTIGERALLKRLEGGCQIPIGAYGRIEDGTFHLDAAIGSLDGKRSARSAIKGSPDDSERLGRELAERLLQDGGEAILAEIRNEHR
jgi:hydroxymethylbilane synthase